MRDVLTQIRIGLEQGFINNGHSAALGRAMSYSSPSAVVREQLSGVDFYLFLRDLLEHFDERLDGLRAKLTELAGRIFVADGCMASFTGSDEDFDAYWDAAGDLGLGRWATAPMPAATRSWCRRRATATRLLSSPATSALRRARAIRVAWALT